MMSNTNSALKVNERRYEQGVNWRSFTPRRGEVYLVDFGTEGITGSEYKGLRPGVVVSNNMNNKYSEILQIAPITSANKTNLPVHVRIGVEDGLKSESLVCLEGTKSVSKQRLFLDGKVIRITQLSSKRIAQINAAIKIQFGLF